MTLRRVFGLCVGLLIQQSHAASTDDLIGCWKATQIAQVFDDGSRSLSQGGQCTLEFKRDEFVSSCAYSKVPVTSTYRYSATSAGKFAATMTTSSVGTQLIGTSRDYDYKVDGQTLLLITQPKTPTPAAGTAAAAAGAAIRIESESVKAPCPE
ncbi:MAG: hypothetical protein H7255_01500 [Ramlibacter sp.]|nr:hypothetical protein [Ramlibacter sp.]